MGCLIKLTFTKKFTEKPAMFFLSTYPKEFTKSEIMKKEIINEKMEVSVYVHMAENRTSRFLKKIVFDSRIFRAEIVA